MVTPLFGNAIKAGETKPVTKPLFDNAVAAGPGKVETRTPTPLTFGPSASNTGPRPPIKANALFAGAESNASKAHQLLVPALKDKTFSEHLLTWMSTLVTEVLARGVRKMEEAIEEIGRENMAVHNAISDYNIDYDRLEVGKAIQKAHQLITGKKGLFERGVNINDVVPHLEAISKEGPTLKDRTESLEKRAGLAVERIEALQVVYEVTYPSLPSSDTGRVGSTLAALKTSVALLMPQVQMLRNEATLQLEDVNRMLMVAIPTWKSAQK